MQITNEILLSFLHCSYKAYRKYKTEIGDISDYEKLSNDLKYSQKLLFTAKIASENKLIAAQSTESKFTFTEGIIIDKKFSDSYIEIILDGIEFIGKNKIIPIFIIPFKKLPRLTNFLFLFRRYIFKISFIFKLIIAK